MELITEMRQRNVCSQSWIHSLFHLLIFLSLSSRAYFCVSDVASGWRMEPRGLDGRCGAYHDSAAPNASRLHRFMCITTLVPISPLLRSFLRRSLGDCARAVVLSLTLRCIYRFQRRVGSVLFLWYPASRLFFFLYFSCMLSVL